MSLVISMIIFICTFHIYVIESTVFRIQDIKELARKPFVHIFRFASFDS